MKIRKTLSTSVLIPLELTGAGSAEDAAIHKNQVILQDLASRTTALIISNEETKDLVKLVKFLEESGLLIKGVGETIKNEEKEQKGGCLGMLSGTLGATFIRKSVYSQRQNYSWQKNNQGRPGFLRPPHPLKNFAMR